MHYGPAVRRRKLGAELRRQRALSGLTSCQAARLVDWHQSKISRIETGRSGVKPADVQRLLDAYGVVDAELRALLTALCGGDAGDGTGRDRRGWWHSYRDVLPPVYRDFISLEAEASWARTLETGLVPGLLQTPDYARAVTRAALPGLPDGRVEALVEVRLARQEVLRGHRPLELWVVLEEAVLRRTVGSSAVMAAQLRHLTRMAGLPHVRLQVLPFTAGVHTGTIGPFVIFSFPPTGDMDVVVIDHLTSSLYLEQREDVRAYSDAFATLRGHALSYEKSSAFIARIAAAQQAGDGA
ncbi:helix-turn-helix transcriptional regulator [Streptomyces sp. MST-110588]|uniref:helix-turn-helix domain-containing protein n=1 Tax=Streptomyces sp. MST-110588 TaxID=2833628 RepID=UPI001F5D6DB7|nr:helix-turn-helix transcriptional regulator [Streptomyces sp. MST-110588]UNO38611.1 helix-turn-helix domain-containing protein [Streptomyces sp. MST-110588]